MGSTYSVYEAKARFSEVLRLAQQGQRVTVTHHGKPIAEIGPAPPKATTIEQRIKELRAAGILSAPTKPYAGLKPLARRPGGLKRFLAERE